MQPRAVKRAVRVAAGLAAAAAGAIALGGCGSVGYVDEGDRQRGKELFTAHCGSCHVLADAGTTGQIGPNLDDGFRQARKDGITQETVVQVVRGQIQYPIEQTVTGAPGMPGIDETLPKCEGERREGCVQDQDEAANAISLYVATVAGVEEGEGGGPTPPAPPPPPPPTDGTTTEPSDGLAAGKQVYESAGCGSCHTLADAGSSGTIGPNLDEAGPSKALAVDRVTNGQGAMPPFRGQLSPEQIDAVATYVSSVAGR